ncbi:MAG: hypothetical protein A2268_15375 [Candidatus Raymondbacteria bacterium RifOxyA12_full_50_37]|nr:MAG: hypothetical protein A2268_15375 [Candidatus Raymondbacteria bacterium RifOxyA12_full_50_37]OGJ88466.1 MAG: hypothetical protein A2248_19890 [Candidatus Raymondbacteria bacterium RIFOXYA2_FULL_49_16]OGJ96448.1 MAG: hypothetical protein A2350_15855 [Candidatus Raymondbacteria bacterium RifOxyB12_full_50_8]OGJ98926.1 MAG: hypothetical protein A2453_10605 [Candidatus Raymondbacteria bacterium RIFOXYC2_FULL_50_21]OGK07922.1 MAG: hypothetical protein A2487_12505 [Candidatus Raymondbacteria b
MNIKQYEKSCGRSAVADWANGSEKVRAFPWLVYIGTTNVCNNRCVVCAYKKTMRSERGFMTMDVFARIVDQLPREVKKVYLMKQGEPFANKNLEMFVEYLHKKRPDIHIAIHSNGILAVRKRLARILPHVSSLGISISGISDKTYFKAHGTANFQKVLTNLTAMSDLLCGMPQDRRPHVFVDYVKQNANTDENESDVVAFYKSRFPGLASVDFHAVFNFQGEIAEGNMEIYDRLPHKVFPCCVYPWSAITFCHDGKVSYCFVEPRENRFLGDITKQSFASIWNSEEYVLFRKRMAGKKFAALAADGFYCHKCTWLWNMQSQSPRSLAGGHALMFNDTPVQPKFHDLLEMAPEALFQTGTAYFTGGEMHLALSCFECIAQSRAKKEVVDAAARMVRQCRKTLGKFRDQPLWNAMLAREKKKPRDRKNTYYSLNKKQGQ